MQPAPSPPRVRAAPGATRGAAARDRRGWVGPDRTSGRGTHHSSRAPPRLRAAPRAWPPIPSSGLPAPSPAAPTALLSGPGGALGSSGRARGFGAEPRRGRGRRGPNGRARGPGPGWRSQSQPEATLPAPARALNPWHAGSRLPGLRRDPGGCGFGVRDPDLAETGVGSRQNRQEARLCPQHSEFFSVEDSGRSKSSLSAAVGSMVKRGGSGHVRKVTRPEGPEPPPSWGT
ncbi:hypothetical protein H8959_015498 [Pygathrix nigripes]